MSKDLNQCNFIGRIGKDVDCKYMPNGNAVVNFSIACSDDYKNKSTGEKVEKTNWINIVAFDRLAEIITEYCTKGSKVFISGKQTTRKWQDQSGNNRYTTEIIANDLQMLDSRGGGGNFNQSPNQESGTAPQQKPASSTTGGMDNFDDDIPF